MRKRLSGHRRVRLVLIGAMVLVGAAVGGTAVANAHVTAPSPGVVAGGFCTYGTSYYNKSTEAAQRINTYILPVAIGDNNFYGWEPTGTNVVLGKPKNAVTVDSGTVALQQAIGSDGTPGAFSTSADNSTDMGTGGKLASQTLALVLNENFSDIFVTPATGFEGLSLVGMASQKLAGVKLTSAQANALNGQAAIQVDIAAETALGDGVLPYGLSFVQLTDLVSQLNGSFNACGSASGFAKAHLYQPYVTSNAFTGRRPSTTTTGWAPKPTYNTFSGEVVHVGRGCPANSIAPDFNNPADTYLADPNGKIALIARGACSFFSKVARAEAAGATAAIIYNRTNDDGSPCTPAPTPGSTGCEALISMGSGGGTVGIPAALVQRSTGLLLLNGTAPVSVFVQQ